MMGMENLMYDSFQASLKELKIGCLVFCWAETMEQMMEQTKV